MPFWNRMPSAFLTPRLISVTSPIAGPHTTVGVSGLSLTVTSSRNEKMYDAGSRWNSLIAWIPALSRYSKRKSTGEASAVVAGAPLTVYSPSFNVVVTASVPVRRVKGSGCDGKCSINSWGCFC